MKLGITVLRTVVGGFFVGHGMQKLTGAFGGAGLESTGQMFEQLGLRPGRHHATAAGVSEAAGGAMLLTGFLTPVGASMIVGTMSVAIRKVHLRNGPWVTKQGYEYNAVLIASALAVAAEGPGPLSLDRLLGTERSGAGVAIAALGAGVLGGVAAIEYGKRQPAAPEPPQEQVVETVREAATDPAVEAQPGN
jgi:putative oxidoreductase